MSRKLLILGLLLSTTAFSFSQTTRLNVNVTGIKSTEGKIWVGIYKFGKNYPVLEDCEFHKTSVITSTKRVCVEFELPNGNYSVKVFHDKNNNGKLDKTFIGHPLENYGVSNNRYNRFGMPIESELKITLSGGDSRVDIKLR